MAMRAKLLEQQGMLQISAQQIKKIEEEFSARRRLLVR
jgi:hypothetical protein